jgi:hypothetical protein
MGLFIQMAPYPVSIKGALNKSLCSLRITMLARHG